MLPRSDQRVGVIGMGLMGSAIAERLGAGCGWDLDPQRCVEATCAQDVFDRSEFVFFCLHATDDVREILDHVTLRAEHCIIDTGTGNPFEVEELAAIIEHRNAQYMDATISGSSVQVRQCDVVTMVGAKNETLAHCRDLLMAFSREVLHVGPCGAGAKMKLVSNLVLGLNRAALAEGLVFASHLGLDGNQVLDVLQTGMAYSKIMDTKGRKMLERDYAVQAKLSQHLKDVQLMLKCVDRDLPLTLAHEQLLEKAAALGYADADNSAVIEALLNESE
ncbi:MAG: NAD(P)-dependent oxidoreductase [Pirellulales bacterium]